MSWLKNKDKNKLQKITLENKKAQQASLLKKLVELSKKNKVFLFKRLCCFCNDFYALIKLFFGNNQRRCKPNFVAMRRFC